MNYNINEIKQVEKILHKQVKNKAILPWVDHLLTELLHDASLKSEGTLHVYYLQNDMLRNAKSFKHYIQSGMSDIASNYELLLRHFQDEEKADKVFDKIINGYVNSDYAIDLAAQDMTIAANLIKHAMYFIADIKQANKASK